MTHKASVAVLSFLCLLTSSSASFQHFASSPAGTAAFQSPYRYCPTSHPQGRRHGSRQQPLHQQQQQSRWRRQQQQQQHRRIASSSRSSSTARTAFLDPASVIVAFDAFAAAFPYATAFLTCAFYGAAADVVAQSTERYKVRQQQAAAGLAPAVAAASASVSGDGSVAMPMPGGAGRRSLSAFFRGGSRSRNALRQQESGPKHDLRRTLAFVLYGGLYQGMALFFIYNDLFVRMFGPGRAFVKVCASQFIMAPLLTLPVAYVFRGLVFGKTMRQALLEDYVKGVKDNGLLFSFWKLWIPIQILFFTVIPVHLRIPFSSCFSFLWTVILSRISAKSG